MQNHILINNSTLASRMSDQIGDCSLGAGKGGSMAGQQTSSPEILRRNKPSPQDSAARRGVIGGSLAPGCRAKVLPRHCGIARGAQLDEIFAGVMA